MHEHLFVRIAKFTLLYIMLRCILSFRINLQAWHSYSHHKIYINSTIKEIVI